MPNNNSMPDRKTCKELILYFYYKNLPMTTNWFFYFLTIHFHGRNCWNFYPNMHSYLLNDENIVLWYRSTHGRISQKEMQQLKKKYIYATFSIYFKMLIDHLVLNGGLPGGSNGKEPACNTGDLGLIPQLGRFPGEGYDNPLQYSYLGNPMDRRAWRATVRGVAKSQTQLSD